MERALAHHLSEVAVSVELETEGMTLNIGPQHPSTHGVLRLVATVDGERATNVRPVIGYMHRGYEKLSEVRTYPQITTIINHGIDWVSGFANDGAVHRGRRAPDGGGGPSPGAVDQAGADRDGPLLLPSGVHGLLPAGVGRRHPALLRSP